MANQYVNDVVRYFKRKTATGYEDPVYFGAEQRFITGLRNSGVNNLEEQFLLGTDTYTETYYDNDGNTIIEKSFHINDNSNYDNYYKIKTIIYKEGGSVDASFYFDGNELVMPNDSNKILFGDGSITYPSLETLYAIDTESFDFNNDSFNIFITDFTTLQKDELYFVSNGTETLILTKITSKRFVKDGHKMAVKESITNHINS